MQEIVATVGTSQSNISQHLAILREKGVLLTRKAVSYTHLDVYKRQVEQSTGVIAQVENQALQTAPLVKVCQMLGELGGGVFLKLGDANPAVTRFDQLGLYALDLDHLAEQRQFCLLYTSIPYRVLLCKIFNPLRRFRACWN